MERSLDVKLLVDDYYAWLRERTTLTEVGNAVEITTPFIDRHNDYIQIYLLNSGGELLLTDDGYTISDLEMSGCSLKSDKRQEILKTTLNGFGVTLKNGELQILANESDFASKKHNLLQAMLAVNDMFYLAKSNIINLFNDDVSNWLDDKDIRYIPDACFNGQSNYSHKFDFIIPKSKNAPERILKTINNLDKTNATALAFSWHDTKDTRREGSEAYAILNDTERKVDKNAINALTSYGINTVFWTKRDNFIDRLAA